MMNPKHAAARLVVICCALTAWGCYPDPAGSHPCDECLECEKCVERPGGPRCAATPSTSFGCAADGNVHSYDSCGADEGISTECPANSECIQPSDTDAECVCVDGWQGDDCDTCADNWVAAQDCAVCANNWLGDECDVCPGNWDPAQNCGQCLPGWTGTDCNTELECYGGELDVVTNLCWQNPPPNEIMDWDLAASYCENLVLGTKSDWRMPSISELRSSIRGCPTTEIGGECEVTDDCNAAACWDPSYCTGCQTQSTCYWIASLSGSCVRRHWSSTPCLDEPGRAWRIGFSRGEVRCYFKTSDSAIRCVRSVE